MAVFGEECAVCGCLFSDSDWDGLYICQTCDFRLGSRDPQGEGNRARFMHKMIMAGRQIERKMAGVR